MSTTFTVPTVNRPMDEAMFADLGVPDVDFATTAEGIEITVPVDLTWEQVIRAKCRLLSADAGREALLWSAFAGWKANRTYLEIAAPTAAQQAAQQRALTQQMQGVLKALLPDLAEGVTASNA